MNRVLVDSSSDLGEDAINNETSVEEIIRALAKSTRMDITSSIDLGTASEYPCAGGSYCDVYWGKKYDGTKIAIKSLRVYQGPEAESQRRKILRHAVDELYLWSKLRHRNILPLIGLMLFRGRISTVSEWMENGNLVSFLLCHPDANRVCLCMDICVGLHYIHDNGMVHGDLKAANVMVSSRGVAMITDFGNAHLKDLTLRISNTTSNSISVRWTAPELLQGTGPGVSKETDVYAFGITALEVLSGETPYKDLNDIQVLHWVVVEKGCPPRPTIDIRNDLWDVLVPCWIRNPTERPTIGKISHSLQALHPDCESHLQRLAVPIQANTQSPDDQEEHPNLAGTLKDHGQTHSSCSCRVNEKVSNDGHLPVSRPISYQLENKIVQLTQTLQQRTNERKAAENQIRDLERQLSTWQAKHEDAENRVRKLQTDIQTLHVPAAKFEELLKSKTEVETQLEAKVAEQEAQNAKCKSEARSAAKQQEIIYLLENKIVQLTQTLQRRTNERKAAESQVRDLGRQLSTWQTRHEQAETCARKLQTDIQTLHVPTTAKFEELLKSKTEVEMRLEAKVAEQEAQITKLSAEVQAAALKLETRANEAASGSVAGDLGQIAALKQELSQMRDQLNRANALNSLGNGLPVEDIRDDPAEERIRLLSDLDRLDHEVYEGLITSLKIPSPTSTNTPSRKEVLFPANLISLISNELWKYGMINESERFLENTMQTIQGHAMSFTREDSIVPGVFWLSNAHEILSFLCRAENDLTQGIGPIGNAPGFDWEAYEHLIQMVKSDLDSLEYNIYYSWMVETKERLSKMIIPALIETQSLPGFITSEGTGRLFNRLWNQNTTPAFSMDDVLNLLNKVLESLKCFFMEESVIQRAVTDLLKLIGMTSFNDLLMRRNFCSSKRAMQIQHNITRIEEWCKSHEMPEGTAQLEHLMQATKLLQLKKATQADIDIIYDNPISPEILKLVAERVQPNDRTDHLLLMPENEDVAPYELPLPREVSGLDNYVPAYLNVPHIRRLAAISP